MISDLAAYVAFAAVVEEGSLSGAARRINSSKAAVSRYVARLESLSGVTLINRTSRRIALTASGAELYETCRGLLGTVVEVDQMMRAMQGAPKGVLRIFAPPVLQASNFPALLARFVAEHRDISIDLQTGNSAPDPAKIPFDVYFFIGNTALPELQQMDIGSYKSVVCAAPSYLAAHGRPSAPEDLLDHECIVQTQRPRGNYWHFASGVEIQVKGRFDSDNAWTALAGATQGLGIARLPFFVVAEHMKSGRLVNLLETFMPEGQRFVLAHRPVRRLPGKLRIFLDFARREFQAGKVLWHEF